ncbi:MAG: alpha-amylase family glycosyl hydrolase [Novosphingobium aromaticivorans]|nr:alpha-amylase family glycosyl hydrolase [Novosphingobium aromaticivorans]
MSQTDSRQSPSLPAQNPATNPADSNAALPWWHGAAIYQIYPRSFADSNGDGIGDLAGITARLDHVARLGADAIWISPFFTSPMRDFGYDVANYCDVDPVFGTLADFDALVARAHDLGLKVTIDQVYAHTSDQHPWFVASRQSRDNPYADWYVWEDPKPDGSPPSNWQSVFGGPAWRWDARRCQYYLHNFLAEQPQVNAHNPAVQQAILDVMRFWLDRGVDGFRIDALNFLMHEPSLRDNPPAPDDGRRRTRPFDYQLKLYNQSHADIVPFVERLRALCDSYGAIFTVAEVGGDQAELEMKAYTAGSTRLNSAYGFDFLYADRITPAMVRDVLARWPDEPGMGWPSWAFENHDAPRAISRWTRPDTHPDMRDAHGRMKAVLFAALRGNIIVYQGEELGLTQVDIPFELLQDPEAIANWPLTLSRDGARTPLPWQAEGAMGGFTEGETPWLPLGEENLARAVDRQEADPASILSLTTRLLHLRRTCPPLRHGSFDVLHADEAVLAVRRMHEGKAVLAVLNMSDQTCPWPEGLPPHAAVPHTAVLVAENGAAPGAPLPAYAALIVEEPA